MTTTAMALKLATFKRAAISQFGDDTDYIYTQSELLEIRDIHNAPIPGVVWHQGKIPFTVNRKLGVPSRTVKKMFDLNLAGTASALPAAPVPATNPNTPIQKEVPAPMAEVSVVSNKVIAHTVQSLIPAINPEYVPFGNYHIVSKIIKANRFFPVLITGLSGNGKTLMVEQASAKLKREYIRTNITIESDEDSLIGGFRLVNGETVWQDGPVIEAMLKGTILLLDEVDLGGDKIMCLQSILEGKGYFIKKTGRHIQPAPGFTIFLTANTKGKGNESGKFVGTRVLNEAMLDRINVCLEQEYPNPAQEIKILNKALDRDCALQGEIATDSDKEFVERIVDWAQAVRKAFFEDSVDDLISTRRASNIVSSYLIFGRDRMMAVKTGVSRFNDEEIESFIKFYEAIDAEANKPPVQEFIEPVDAPVADAPVEAATTKFDNKVPF